MSAATWAEASSHGSVTFVLLAELLLDPAPVRLHTGIGYLTWNAVEWGGVGEFGSVTPLTGGIDLDVNEVELTLSGIPSEHRADVISSLSRGKRVNLYNAFWNYADGDWERQPELAFAGFISHPQIRDEIDEDGPATVTVTVTVLSAFAYARRRTTARRTDAHQQSLYSGDKFYSFKTDTSKPLALPNNPGGARPPGGPKDHWNDNVDRPNLI